MINIDKKTFRHNNGYNNFVHGGIPIGYPSGSDTKDYTFGMNYFNQKNLLFSILLGQNQSGDENITKKVFEPIYTGYSVSNSINTHFYIKSYLQWWFKPNIILTLSTELKSNGIKSKEVVHFIKLDTYFSII